MHASWWVGLVRLCFDRMKKEDKKEKEQLISDGMLYCSGMIAGEGLVGILLALLAVFGLDKSLDLSSKLNLPSPVLELGSLVLFGLVILSLLRFTVWKKVKK